jgi:hypothetical protein
MTACLGGRREREAARSAQAPRKEDGVGRVEHERPGCESALDRPAPGEDEPSDRQHDAPDTQCVRQLKGLLEHAAGCGGDHCEDEAELGEIADLE